MYGKNGMNLVPTTAKEARRRNADQKLHDKLLAIRNGRRQMGQNRPGHGRSLGLIELTSDVVLNLVFAIEHGKLNPQVRCLFEKLTRAEILCWLLQEISYVYRMNKERYGYKEERKHFFSIKPSESDVLLHNIFRLTREEITEKYGAEDWHSHYRVNNEIYECDVAYGKFLRDHGLGYCYGGNITEADLPPIDVSALYGNDPLARATTMQRLAREAQRK